MEDTASTNTAAANRGYNAQQLQNSHFSNHMFTHSALSSPRNAKESLQPTMSSPPLGSSTMSSPPLGSSTMSSPPLGSSTMSSPPLGSSTMSTSSSSRRKRSSSRSDSELKSTTITTEYTRPKDTSDRSMLIRSTRGRDLDESGHTYVGSDAFKDERAPHAKTNRGRFTRKVKGAVRGFFTKQNEEEADVAYVEDRDWTELQGLSEEPHECRGAECYCGNLNRYG